MTREEAIKVLSSYDVNGVWADVDGKPYNAEEQAEAFDMAIEALEGVRFDEWCDDCKEYDTEKKCCPRFNKVIREALKREPSEDGTLEVKVEDATKVGRVLISDDKHRGGLYYPDENEPKGDDLISRAEAIEAMGEEPLVWCYDDYEIAERNQWRDDVEAIKSVPPADRPQKVIAQITFDEEKLREIVKEAVERFKEEYEITDRPRGEWINENGTYYANCSKCGYQMDTHEERGYHNFCPNCGADMRGEDE